MKRPHRRIAISLGLVAFLLGWTGNATGAPFAYVTNVLSNNVSIIDTATNRETARVPVGEAPVGVAVHPDGSRVYVADARGGTVSVIETATNRVSTFPVAALAVAVNPQGTRVYVTRTDSQGVENGVAVIDTATNRVIETFQFGFELVDVAVHPDGTRLYVADYVTKLWVIDLVTRNVSAVPAGFLGVELLLDVEVTPDGRRVYMIDETDRVFVIDTVTNNVVAEVQVGGQPRGIALNPAGTRVYVTRTVENSVSVIDTADNRTIATVPLGPGSVPGGPRPTGIAVHPDGTRVYTVNNADRPSP